MDHSPLFRLKLTRLIASQRISRTAPSSGRSVSRSSSAIAVPFPFLEKIHKPVRLNRPCVAMREDGPFDPTSCSLAALGRILAEKAKAPRPGFEPGSEPRQGSMIGHYTTRANAKLAAPR